MTTTTAAASTQTSLKCLAHGAVLTLWLTAGGVFTLGQLFAERGLGAAMNDWLWFAGPVGVTTLGVRFFRSGVAVLIGHAAVALVLNLIPTARPFAMLRAGSDLLVGR